MGKRRTLFLLLLPLVGTSVGMAQAQPRMIERRPPSDMKMFEARRTADLALLLDLKPAQKPALDAFLTSTRHGRPPEADEEGRAPPPLASVPRSFSDRLDAMEKRLTESNARRQARIVAARQFYDQLDATQKQRFDALERFRPPAWGGPGRIIHHRRMVAAGGDVPPELPEPGASD